MTHFPLSGTLRHFLAEKIGEELDRHGKSVLIEHKIVWCKFFDKKSLQQKKLYNLSQESKWIRHLKENQYEFSLIDYNQ